MDYVTVFLLAFLESAAVVGLAVPGTTLIAAAGAAAQAGLMNYWGIVIAAIIGAFFGDAASYYLGSRLHEWKRFQPWLERHKQGMSRAENIVKRWGALGVIVGRFLAPTRSFVPLIAGTAKMPWWRFLIANISGAIGWSFFTVTLGEEALRAFERLPKKWSLIILGSGLVLWLIYRLTMRIIAHERAKKRHAPVSPQERKR